MGVKLNGFLDSLYIVLYPSIIHFLALKSIVREILDKNTNSGFDDPCFSAKEVGGKTEQLFRFPVYVFLIVYNTFKSFMSNNKGHLRQKWKIQVCYDTK